MNSLTCSSPQNLFVKLSKNTLPCAAQSNFKAVAGPSGVQAWFLGFFEKL